MVPERVGEPAHRRRARGRRGSGRGARVRWGADLSGRAEEVIQKAIEVFADAVTKGEETKAEDAALIAFAVGEVERAEGAEAGDTA